MFKKIIKVVLRVPFEFLKTLGVLTKINGPQILRHQELLEYFNTFRIDNSVQIVDIGCGDGDFLNLLKNAGYKNLNGCDWRAPRNEGFIYRQIDLNNEFLLSYSDASIDVLFCSDVIEHLENPAKTLREFQRVLKPKGLAFITIPNSWNILERLYFLFLANSNRYKSERRSAPYGHISFFTSEIIESLIDRAKLDLISDCYGSGYFNKFALKKPRRKIFGYNYMFVLQKNKN